MRKFPPPAERLMNGRVIVGDCWEWSGAYTRDGYGVITVEKKQHRVHRLSFRLLKGESPEGKLVCHSCDNPRCFNPAHLFLGTNTDNMADMKGKGRGVVAHGQSHVNAKLTDDQAREIKHRRNVLGEKLSAIGSTFGISFQLVSEIARGKRWTHI